ncbi:hypothetical protein ACSMXM_15600 [Pacificimonas sp. ICDLI1SI03]
MTNKPIESDEPTTLAFMEELRELLVSKKVVSEAEWRNVVLGTIKRLEANAPDHAEALRNYTQVWVLRPERP